MQDKFKNKNLHTAKTSKKDEFYTQLSDIEKELRHYKGHFKGKVGTDIALDSIRSKWGKMTSKNLMGYEFNLNYPTEAKTRGWIDSKKSSFYHLRDKWMSIFD